MVARCRVCEFKQVSHSGSVCSRCSKATGRPTDPYGYQKRLNDVWNPVHNPINNSKPEMKEYQKVYQRREDIREKNKVYQRSEDIREKK